MAQKALFISVNDLKKKSIIHGMVDDDKIIHFIEIAQDIHIHQYLGTKLYDKLQADVIASSLTGDYLTLVNDYVKPMLIWYSQAEYLPFAGVSIGNDGMYRRLPENSEAIESKEQAKLVARIMENADFYAKRFLDHICENETLYPEYRTNQSGDIYPDQDAMYSNWVL
jgi:hypothetical protein